MSGHRHQVQGACSIYSRFLLLSVTCHRDTQVISPASYFSYHPTLTSLYAIAPPPPKHYPFITLQCWHHPQPLQSWQSTTHQSVSPPMVVCKMLRKWASWSRWLLRKRNWSCVFLTRPPLPFSNTPRMKLTCCHTDLAPHLFWKSHLTPIHISMIVFLETNTLSYSWTRGRWAVGQQGDQERGDPLPYCI